MRIPKLVSEMVTETVESIKRHGGFCEKYFVGNAYCHTVIMRSQSASDDAKTILDQCSRAASYELVANHRCPCGCNNFIVDYHTRGLKRSWLSDDKGNLQPLPPDNRPNLFVVVRDIAYSN